MVNSRLRLFMGRRMQDQHRAFTKIPFRLLVFKSP